MKKTVWKGGTLLAPVPPVIVSCGNMESSNLITIAWTGIINSDPPKTYISVRPERHSYNIIKQSGEFIINLPTCCMAFATDYCGIKTGRTVDKFAKTGLSKSPSQVVACPQIEQSPISLECKVFDVKELGSHHMFFADIVSVSVDGSLIDKSGKLNLDQAELMAFSHGEYFALGKKLGRFGFSCVKKKKQGNNRDGNNRPSKSARS